MKREIVFTYLDTMNFIIFVDNIKNIKKRFDDKWATEDINNRWNIKIYVHNTVNITTIRNFGLYGFNVEIISKRFTNRKELVDHSKYWNLYSFEDNIIWVTKEDNIFTDDDIQIIYDWLTSNLNTDNKMLFMINDVNKYLLGHKGKKINNLNNLLKSGVENIHDIISIITNCNM